jgi:hypothetical protein
MRVPTAVIIKGIVGAVGFATGAGLGFSASVFLFYRMLAEVNAASSEADQINSWAIWAGTGKTIVFRRHRELYPQSKLRRRFYFTVGLGALLMLASFVSIIQFQ